ncbi:MAG: T9SS type A sorting domain-containing protein [Bacteroidales bacterium]|nr:MAG: T9SS type A sorting domain-containing protein [Bacteroidales bacterium]
MKGKIKFTLTLSVLMLFSLAQINAQSWHVYDGSQLPADAGFSSADVKGKAIVHSIVDDPDIPGNKLYEYYVDSADSKQQWEADFGGPVDYITVVTRMKSSLPDTFIGVSNIRLYNGVNRVVFKLEDGRINPENTLQNVNYDMDGTEWHIFRFVMDGAFVKVYLDERPKPVMVDTSASLNSNTYFRFGDGSDGDEYGGQVDWIVWDTSGAYPPGAGAVIPQALLYPDAPALMAKWSFNGSLEDDVGDADAVVDNNGFEYVKSIADSAINFLVASDEAQLAVPLENSEQLHFGTGSFSMSMLAKFDPGAGEQILVIKGDMGQDLPTTSLDRKGNWYALSCKNDEFRFTIDDDVKKAQLGGKLDGIYLPGSKWYHIVGVRDTEQDSTFLYINGKLVASMLDETANVMVDSMPVTIGSLTNRADRKVYGAIDEIEIYNYALSPTEVMSMYDTYPIQNIFFVTDADQRDSLYMEFLEDNGFNVNAWVISGLADQPQSTIDMINSNDLAIIGRAPLSGNFTQANKYAWNKEVEIPLILTTQWAGRSTRLNWFNSTSCVHYDTDPDTIVAKINDPADAVFAGASIDADSMMAWSVAPEDAILLDTTTNGTILATYNTNAVLFARFEPCVEFYDGAGVTEKPAAPRTYFGMGNDNMGWPNFFPILEDVKGVLLAEINRLLTDPYTVCTDYPADDATLASLDVDAGELMPAFDPAVTEYKVTVPQGTASVNISAVANDAGATVADTGDVDVSGGMVTAPVTVTAADGYNTMVYNIMFEIPVIVDGVIGGGEWDRADSMVVEKPINVNNIDDENDYSLYFKMLWNDSALYLLIDVTDDAIFLGHTNIWEDDNIEVYFDMNNSKIQKWPRDLGWSGRPWAQMDDNDMQLRFQPTTADIGYESNLGVTTVVNGITYAQTQSGTGYIFEMMFDFDSLAVGYPEFVAVAGTEIGFDIDASDNDDNPSARDEIGWSADRQLIYTDAGLWGTLMFNADGTVTQILDTEAPTAPANLAASVDGYTVTLTWDASTDNIIVDEYNIYVNSLPMGTVMAQESVNGGAIPDIPPGNYTVGISAVDPSDNESDISTIDVEVVVVSIDEREVSYNIYPVPATEILVVENTDYIEQIEIFNMVGESILNIAVEAKHAELDISDLKPGVYVIKLHTAKEVFSEQLLIE